MQRITQNSFSGGRNTDLDKNLIPPNQYLEAHNVELSGDGKFLSLQQIKGDLSKQEISSNSTIRFMGEKPCTFYREATQDFVSGFVIFSYVPSSTFNIRFYDAQNNQLYDLYQEAIDSSYTANDRLIDVINYPENGKDHLYFVDNKKEIRKLRCVIPSVYTPNFLTEEDLSLQRLGANGIINLSNILTDQGSLLSGTYQFAYRMVDLQTKTLTKWSSLTNPIHVYSEDNDPNNLSFVYSAIGLSTKFAIELEITPTQAELDRFQHFQLAVIENVYPSDRLEVSILPIEPVSSLSSYVYKANTKVNTVPVDEVVTNYAAIETAKTLSIAQKSLVAGNIKYKQFSTPQTTLVGGSILTKTDDAYDPYSSHVFSSKYRGYFRDEVYRFGIVYFDKYGNRYPVKVLDLSSITGNQINSTEAPQPTQLFTNENFTSGFTGWTTLAGDFTWAIGSPGTLAVFYTPASSGLVSDVQYQNPTFSGTATNYQLTVTTRKAVTPDGFNGIVRLRIVFLNGTSVISTQNISTFSISSSTGVPITDTIGNLVIPGTTTGIGFQLEVVTIFNPGTINVEIDSYSLYESEAASAPVSTLTDLKFPSRSTVGGDYTLFDSNGKIQALGLHLTGLDNHPVDAVGFEIVRAKRIPNILFQSPVIPMMSIEGVGAKNAYPSAPKDVNGDQLSFPDAQPQAQSKVQVTQNLFWPELRKITRDTAGSGVMETTSSYEYSMLFPPSFMYVDKPESFTGGEKLEIIDYSALKLLYGDGTPNGTQTGDTLDTSVTGTLYSALNEEYYYQASHGGKAILPKTDIVDHEFFTPFGEGGSVAGGSVLKYDLLQTTQPTYGTQPDVQKSSVVKHKPLTFPYSMSFSAVTFNPYSAGGTIASGSSLAFESIITNKYIWEYPNWTPNSYVNKLPIANITTGATNSRYGDADTDHEFISTGAKYFFSTSELVDLAASNSVPVDIDIWGGDCFVGLHTFKICNGSYLLTYNNKDINLNSDDIVKYLYYYLYPKKLAGQTLFTGNYALKFAVGVKASAQYVQVVLESEYNGEVMPPKDKTYGNVNNMPIWMDLSEDAYRLPADYGYNINLSKQNDQRIDRIKPELGFEQNNFVARVIYSDPKIYNSSEQGFDVFRVLNFLDLEEKGGSLTKLALVGDRLFAIQQKHITQLPVGETQAELTDASTIQVGTGTFFGRPIILDTEHGGQHLRGIVETGNSLYIPDGFNKSIHLIAAKSFDTISNNFNVTEFLNFFSSEIPEHELRGFWHPTREEFWLSSTSKTEVWNSKLKLWVGDHEYSNRILGAAYSNLKFYLIGKNNGISSVYEHGAGNYNELIGVTIVPRVKFSVNPENSVTKTFDNFQFEATDQLDTVDVLVERASGVGNQENIGMIIANYIENSTYRIKILLDSAGSRMRGLRMITTVKWGSTPSLLTAVSTKYRLSSRVPY